MTTPRARRHATPTRPAGGRIGIALAGGGPLGGTYEVGALCALADSIPGLDLAALDVYVGVSSGAFLAAALANGLSPAQMYRLFIEGGADAALKPALLLRPALAEYLRRFLALPLLAGQALAQYATHPLRAGSLGAFASLARAVPTGLFDNRAIDAFLRDLFTAPGRSNDFRRLRHKLYLVATNLDTGNAVVFGAPGFDHVPVSRAIRASSALPGLFPPVTIDGEHYVDGALIKTLHASLALDDGVSLLLCVNPLVPFDAGRAQHAGGVKVRKLSHGGLPLVLSQTFRAIIHSRMQVGMEKYERSHPDADVLLFQPPRENAEMFFANIFSYAHRGRVCAEAFATTRADLRARADVVDAALRRHGLALDRARLHDGDRTIADAVRDPRPLRAYGGRRRSVRDATRELTHALHELERELATLR